jgi:hypothetical protein
MNLNHTQTECWSIAFLTRMNQAKMHTNINEKDLTATVYL